MLIIAGDESPAALVLDRSAGRMIALWGHILGSAIVRWLPRRVWYRIADLLLPLVLLGWSGHVQRAGKNMRRILGSEVPEREVRRWTVRAFRNYARYLIDLLWLGGSSAAEREAAATMVGLEHVAEALSRGNGLVLVSGHLGNWDLPISVLAGRGYAVNVIVETLDPPAWDARVQAIRERIGVRAVSMETGVRDLYAALRRNETVALVFDRPLESGGVPVRFFGAETRIPAGMARMALRTGAAVVGAVGLRRGDTILTLVSPPFDVPISGNREADVRVLTQAIVSWLEGYVRQYPDQWFMFRDFWPDAAGA
jgi:KDO2-lipid IV(A) lauroyltransferase